MRLLSLRLRPFILASTFAAALSGCVHEVDESGVQLNAENTLDVKGAVIVGGVNWQEASSLAANTVERSNANAVGFLSIPAKGSRCTAFLIANNLVMTNQHCISESSHAVGATVSFRNENGVGPADQATYSCESFLGANDGLDYALLQCAGNPGAAHGVLTLDEGTPALDDNIYVLHQNCDYYQNPWCDPTKKISRGNLTRVGTELQYDADTLGGSSGAPVFDASTHNVIGLHHVGIGGNASGRGWANSAVRIDRVVDHIQARWPDLVLGPTVAPAPVLNDAFEPNNNRQQATLVVDGDVLDALHISSEDVDLFQLDLNGAATVNVSLAFAHALGDLDAAIYVGQAAAPSARAESADDNEQMTADVVGGPVYIMVYGYNGASNDYTLTVDVDVETVVVPEPTEPEPTEPEPTEPAPVQGEPNDSPTSANDLPVPGSVSDAAISSGGDIDFYRIHHLGGALYVQLDFTHAIGDLDLNFYSAAGGLLRSSESITDREVISGDFAAGDYLIRVLGYAGAAGDYSLIVDAS